MHILSWDIFEKRPSFIGAIILFEVKVQTTHNYSCISCCIVHEHKNKTANWSGVHGKIKIQDSFSKRNDICFTKDIMKGL